VLNAFRDPGTADSVDPGILFRESWALEPPAQMFSERLRLFNDVRSFGIELE
jgi:hypothetical protein